MCIYAARYDVSDIGGIDAIHSVWSRSRSSIQMKIQNIVAMCDEEGISRNPGHGGLAGLPAGRKGRRTNWSELSEYAGVTREAHLAECLRITGRLISWPGELAESDDVQHVEGARRRVVVNAYERDPVARRKCLQHHGFSCVICGFDFLRFYGSAAEGFIHVHHLKPLSEIRGEYVVDPVDDLRPVCPNCHAVIHLGGRTRSIEEVHEMVRDAGQLAPPE